MTLDAMAEGGEPTAPEDPENLSRQIRSGLGWSMVNTLALRSGTLILGIFLARILTPDDYGVFAVGLVVLNILQSMNELGVSMAVVRWQGDDVAKVARTASMLAVASSALLYAVCFLAAPAFARGMGVPEATGVLRLLSLGVILDGISSVPNALLMRAFLQARRAAAEVTALVTYGTVTITLAATGHGAWSLAWGALVGNATTTTLIFLLAPGRPLPGWNGADARRLLSFGLPHAGTSLLTFAMLNVDYIITGRVLGPVALGLYVLAFNLSSWPSNILSFSVRRVSIAGFARLLDQRDELRRHFVKNFGLLISVALPACLVLSLLPEPLVRFVYGNKWAPAAQALRFLAVLGLIRVAVDFCFDLLVAAGRSRTTLVLQGIWITMLIPTLAIGAHVSGIRGVAIGHVIVALGIVLPAYMVALHRMGIRPLRVARELVRPALAGAVAAGVILAIRGVIDSDFGELAASGVFALGAYAAIAVPFREVLPKIRRRLNRERDLATVTS